MAKQTLVDQTIQVWQSSYNIPLTQEDGEEVLSNWSAYINLISEWTAQYKQAG
jgi:hypothetical protein